MTTPTDDVIHASVVICTRNRPDKIGTAVESVLGLDYPDYDVTVIDQSTSDETRLALEPYSSDKRLRYLHFDEAGLSRAYNNGIRVTEGEVIAFTDDDCIAPADWLTNIVKAFETDPDGDLLYGRVEPWESGEGYDLTPLLDVPFAERLSKHDSHYKVFGMGANFAARRRLFQRIGYFDELLGGGAPLRSSQDYDLSYRTYQGGGVILLRPDVAIRHDGRREVDEWPALLLNYGHGDGAFYMKHARCRDLSAVWLLVHKFTSSTSRFVVKKLIGRRPNDFSYIRGFVAGMRASFKYRVDRRARLYCE